jgi:hypothetical protein
MLDVQKVVQEQEVAVSRAVALIAVGFVTGCSSLQPVVEPPSAADVPAEFQDRIVCPDSTVPRAYRSPGNATPPVVACVRPGAAASMRL